MPHGTPSPEVTLYLTLLGHMGTCREVAQCAHALQTLVPADIQYKKKIKKRFERSLNVLLRMVLGNPCLGKTVG